MRKLFCMIALAAISFSSVYAHGTAKTIRTSMQVDTTKKKKVKTTKRDSTRKKDTIKVQK